MVAHERLGRYMAKLERLGRYINAKLRLDR